VRGAFDKLQYRQQIWHRLGEQHSAAVAKWQYFNYQQLQQVSKERERERKREKRHDLRRDIFSINQNIFVKSKTIKSSAVVIRSCCVSLAVNILLRYVDQTATINS